MEWLEYVILHSHSAMKNPSRTFEMKYTLGVVYKRSRRSEDCEVEIQGEILQNKYNIPLQPSETP
jgi:hypothetical protein